MRPTADPRNLDVRPVPLDAVLGLRDRYLHEMRCQVVHDSWHARGFTTIYDASVEGQVVGYGAVGGPPGEPRDTVKEFYIEPSARGEALPLFRRLIATSGARAVEAQTNDRLLMLMLCDVGEAFESDIILFEDAVQTAFPPPAVVFRPVADRDRARMFPHAVEPVGEWGLDHDGEIVATGGVLLHYNPPYGDLYMEVAEPYRGRGLGRYLVQELKRACREMGRIPAARCHQANRPSRAALQRAGMFPCARIVRGRIAREA